MDYYKKYLKYKQKYYLNKMKGGASEGIKKTYELNFNSYVKPDFTHGVKTIVFISGGNSTSGLALIKELQNKGQSVLLCPIIRGPIDKKKNQINSVLNKDKELVDINLSGDLQDLVRLLDSSLYTSSKIMLIYDNNLDTTLYSKLKLIMLEIENFFSRKVSVTCKFIFINTMGEKDGPLIRKSFLTLHPDSINKDSPSTIPSDLFDTYKSYIADYSFLAHARELGILCKTHNMDLIHFSTVYIFKGVTPIEESGKSIDEPNIKLEENKFELNQTTLNSDRIYGYLKRKIELELIEQMKSTLDVRAKLYLLRLPGLYDIYNSETLTSTSPGTIIEKSLKKDPKVLDNSQLRYPVAASTIASICLKIINHGIKPKTSVDDKSHIFAIPICGFRPMTKSLLSDAIKIWVEQFGKLTLTPNTDDKITYDVDISSIPKSELMTMHNDIGVLVWYHEGEEEGEVYRNIPISANKNKEIKEKINTRVVVLKMFERILNFILKSYPEYLTLTNLLITKDELVKPIPLLVQKLFSNMLKGNLPNLIQKLYIDNPSQTRLSIVKPSRTTLSPNEVVAHLKYK